MNKNTLELVQELIKKYANNTDGFGGKFIYETDFREFAEKLVELIETLQYEAVRDDRRRIGQHEPIPPTIQWELAQHFPAELQKMENYTLELMNKLKDRYNLPTPDIDQVIVQPNIIVRTKEENNGTRTTRKKSSR